MDVCFYFHRMVIPKLIYLRGGGISERVIYILAKGINFRKLEGRKNMRRKEEYKQNNFNGNVNFSGQTQIAAGDIINNISQEKPMTAKYTPEPIWRSPFTLAVLTWISTIIAIVGIFPIVKIVKNIVCFFTGTYENIISLEMQKYSIIFAILAFLFLIFLGLRRIVQRQTRHPLFFNFAIRGYGGRLVLEKIHIVGCPKCGGKMKYYNKPVERREIIRSDGSIKYEVSKRIPVLECKRNAEHWYAVDPAEDWVEE